MKWSRRRPTGDVPPLEVPDDLGSGTEARSKALERLHDVVADEEASKWTRVLDRIVQDNHIREYLQHAHGRN